jgi:hypothetical protein
MNVAPLFLHRLLIVLWINLKLKYILNDLLK